MKLSEVLSRANKLLRYMRTRQERKLYTQWVEMAGLPREAVPQEIIGLDVAHKKNRV